jgi:DNA mismatch endonuclease, patch repair protein
VLAEPKAASLTDYPFPTSEAAAASLRGNRKRDTRPERRVRALLHRRGLRFRVNHAIHAGGTRTRADIVFTRVRVAVFIDGCFWHQCPQHGNLPRQNTDYWGPKLARNVKRDEEVTTRLLADGWHVLRIWEHTPAEEAAATVVHALASHSRSR